MKVLFLSHYFPPEGNAPATRTFEHLRRWVRSGHQATVITCAPSVPHGKIYPGYENAFLNKSEMEGIQVSRIWTYIAANKGKGRRSVNYVSYFFSSILAGLFVKKPDVLIATSPQFFCGCAGAVLAKIRRIPFILEVRDIWPDSIIAVNAIKSNFVLKWMLRMEQWLYACADHIVTVGDGYKKILTQKGVSQESISIITNGADLQQFHPSNRENAEKKKITCSFIGTLGMASKLEVVIKAAQHLDSLNEPNIDFLLVGDGAEYENLVKRAREIRTQRIRFTGLVNKAKIVDYLEQSDICLVHLKKSDLFKTVIPSKLFEAMAAGVPVLIGVQGCAEAIVTKSNCGLAFEPENHIDLCNRILQLISNKSTMREMGNNGRRYLEKHFNRDKLADDYLKILEQFSTSKDAEFN